MTTFLIGPFVFAFRSGSHHNGESQRLSHSRTAKPTFNIRFISPALVQVQGRKDETNWHRVKRIEPNEMNTTSVSLLERLRQPGDQEANWKRFVQLYTPLFYHWARRLGLSSADAADLVQEVFAILVRKLPDFTYDRQRSFRGWLRTVTLNKWRDLRRRRTLVQQGGKEDSADLAGPDDIAEFEEAEYRQHLVKRAFELMQSEFHPTTWRACWEYMVADRPAAEVAKELGITVNGVYLAKSRVLSRLRQELDGLLD
jgi:RNA polymerase sigma-70 factor, ECF subfamily